tara:strand:+ start:4011 stop:4451 length:441 start_codon:yes stop_codon:yes gene_type:complete
MNYLCCFCKQRNEINKLKTANNSIALFSLNNHKYKAKVVNVYDGDTIKVVILFHNKLTRFSLRMTGYDSPELRTKNQNEKAAAIKARDALSNKINNKIIDLHCGKFDKYGRLLGTVYLENLNINKWMIDNNYGYEYNGGTKQKFKQ